MLTSFMFAKFVGMRLKSLWLELEYLSAVDSPWSL